MAQAVVASNGLVDLGGDPHWENGALPLGRTIRQILFSPGRFFCSLTPSWRILPAVFYGAAVWTVYGAFSFLWRYLAIREVYAGPAVISTDRMIVAAIISPVFFLVWSLALSIPTFCVGFVIARRGFRSIPRAIRVAAYSSTPLLLAVFPGGDIIGLPWAILLWTYGLIRSFRG